MPFCLFKTPQPSMSLFFILIYSNTILIKYTILNAKTIFLEKSAKFSIRIHSPQLWFDRGFDAILD